MNSQERKIKKEWTSTQYFVFQERDRQTEEKKKKKIKRKAADEEKEGRPCIPRRNRLVRPRH